MFYVQSWGYKSISMNELMNELAYVRMMSTCLDVALDLDRSEGIDAL
jgi:hypothetical protein